MAFFQAVAASTASSSSSECAPVPSLAPSQGLRSEPDRVASLMGVEPFSYVLRWPITGTIICRCSDPTGDPDVESLARQLERGIFADCGAPAVEYTNLPDKLLDMPIDEYVLFYCGDELKEGQHFSHYNIPAGANIDVVRRHIDVPVGNSCRCSGHQRYPKIFGNGFCKMCKCHWSGCRRHRVRPSHYYCKKHVL